MSIQKKIPFRDHHILALMNGYDQQALPLDLFISHYYKGHPSLGSKDRGYIADTIFAMIRWKALLDYLVGTPCSWEQRLEKFQEVNLTEIQTKKEIPLAIRLSFPQQLLDRLIADYGEEKAINICLASNDTAPTMIRVNPLKISRDELLKRWAPLYDVSAAHHSPLGIQFHKKIAFFTLDEFKEGLFEIQDEGSQLLAQLVQAKPGDHVLDYCAGSGGKTLAFAHLMQQKGQIFLHDIRPTAIQEARRRLKRAGIQNAQFLQQETPQLQKLKKKMDWVLLDVPCSGTGTLRRNPDMKWKIDDALLARLRGQQRTIFEKGLSFLRSGGRIVYGTCSLLKMENEEQVDHFIRTYDLELEGQPFQSFPAAGEMDGFFAVVLKRK